MSGRTKPTKRRKYAARSEGITTTRMYNTRLNTAEIERIMGACKAALQGMRQGAASYQQFVVLCTACHVAKAIEDAGIITGQREIIDEASETLERVGQRSGQHASQWQTTTCHGHELTAMADLVSAHSRQVHELTYGEYVRASQKAVARVATEGGQVFNVKISTA